MATENGAPCKCHVEGVQTVVPTMPTDPRQSRTILGDLVGSAAVLQRRFHVLLCYNKASHDDSGWLVAGRIKESLGRALQQEPLLAGRLRRSAAELEIVSNDSGVRLVEAKAEVRLGDFVELKLKKGAGAGAGAELVFWEDVLEHNPQYSPLFYVQVTNFSCGGYSIGISCSLLLIDPFALTTFLKNWAHIHNNISVSDHPPTFYLPHHGKPPSSPALLMGSNTFTHASQTALFKIPANTLTPFRLAALCVAEAEREVGRELAPNLSLFVQAPSEDAKIEMCSRQGLLESSSHGFDMNGVKCVRNWDDLELDGVCFNEGKKPVYVSCWINSVVDEGSVMIVPFDDAGVQVLVTFS